MISVLRSGTALGLWALVLALSACAPGDSRQVEARRVEASPIVARGDLAADEQATIELFRDASPSVVFVTTLALRRDYFTLDVTEIPAGSGSGFLWDENGHVVTNFHVIQRASGAQITLADESVWDASLVGVAPDKDLAVLRIDAPRGSVHPIRIGTSADLQVGQKVFAIGNPFGLDHSLTTGIISALGREISAVTGRTIGGVIQTDAAINPGNSGGPLLDSAGRVIGMNTMILSPSGVNAGIGFAVPIDTIRRLVPQLIERGRVSRAGLGIQTLDDWTARQVGVRGVVVRTVTPNSAADDAGLQGLQRDARGRLVLGDVIIGVEGKEIASTEALADALDEYAVGDTVRVQLRREGKEIQVPVVLQELPEG